MSVHIQCQSFIYTLSLCRGHSCLVRLAKQETLTPPGHLLSWFAGVREFPSWCSIIGATVTVHQFFCILHFVTLVPLPCEAGSTVPREGFDSSAIFTFSWYVVAVTIYCRSTSSVKPLYIHFRCVASIHGGCGMTR